MAGGVGPTEGNREIGRIGGGIADLIQQLLPNGVAVDPSPSDLGLKIEALPSAVTSARGNPNRQGSGTVHHSPAWLPPVTWPEHSSR